MCYEGLNVTEAGKKRMVHVMDMKLVKSNVYGWSEE